MREVFRMIFIVMAGSVAGSLIARGDYVIGIVLIIAICGMIATQRR